MLSHFTIRIKNAIIDNNKLWCRRDSIDNDLFYPMKRIDYSTLTYVIDDRYLYILRYLFNNFLDELVINMCLNYGGQQELAYAFNNMIDI